MKTIAIISKTDWAKQALKNMATLTDYAAAEKARIYDQVHKDLIKDGVIEEGRDPASYNICFNDKSDAVEFYERTPIKGESILEHLRETFKEAIAEL